MEELKAEVSRLRRELAQAEMEREIVKSGRVLCEGVAAARYAVMKELQARHDYPVAVLCSALGSAQRVLRLVRAVGLRPVSATTSG